MPAHPPDDTYTTGGRTFRTPAHAAMVSALGRALWNFLATEETVVAVLNQAEGHGVSGFLSSIRALPAGGKENRLEALRESQAVMDWPNEWLALLDAAIADFRQVRKTWRNALMHSHAYTVEPGPEYQPGLAHTDSKTKEVTYLADDASDLLDIAQQIEDARGNLSELHKVLLRANRKARGGLDI
jgi:hypothetical protein